MTSIAIIVALIANYGTILFTGVAEKRATHWINHYEISVPASYRIRNLAPPVDDFELYEIVPVGRRSPHLMLYFGNHPAFPRLKWSTPAIVETQSGRTSKEYSYSTEKRQMEGLIVFDGLSYKDSGGSPFTCIHYFAVDVKANEWLDFASIVESIRVAKVHLD